MSTHGFKVGDAVQLKSGGPKMTIKSVLPSTSSEETICCQWFAGSKLQEGWFTPASLQKAKDDK